MPVPSYRRFLRTVSFLVVVGTFVYVYNLQLPYETTSQTSLLAQALKEVKDEAKINSTTAGEPVNVETLEVPEPSGQPITELIFDDGRPPGFLYDNTLGSTQQVLHGNDDNSHGEEAFWEALEQQVVDKKKQEGESWRNLPAYVAPWTYRRTKLIHDIVNLVLSHLTNLIPSTTAKNTKHRGKAHTLLAKGRQGNC